MAEGTMRRMGTCSERNAAALAVGVQSSTDALIILRSQRWAG